MARYLLTVLVALTALLIADPLKLSPITDTDFNPAIVRLEPLRYDVASLDRGNRLSFSERLLEGKLRGPESMAFDAQGKGPYTGINDGTIIKVSDDRQSFETFAWTSTNRSAACGDKLEAEDTCGRVLGLKFHPKTGDLWLMDAYFGLMKVGPEGGLATVVSNEAEGQRFQFANDLDIASDGSIYFTDTSPRWKRRQFILAFAEGQPEGRLLKYDPATNVTTVLLKELRFANGVALSSDESFVLVNELSLARIVRYWLKGPKAGSHDIFFDNLPGYPDNIRPDGRGGFWVALHTGRSKVMDSIFFWPSIRSFCFKLPFKPFIWYLVYVGKPIGLILNIDEDGKAQDALIDSLGRVFAAASEVEEHNGKLYLGSVFNPYIGVYDLARDNKGAGADRDWMLERQ
eukprot:TRINITY_DN18884_c0_g1_i1.p1 TRINITY_DN18884_c0_g1~~TRINITY_DN18884_c0_g1_i1.p1  ORF type:complete len:422 (+),score=95.29 TRINITY_DN18884_c0_g1_i1:63-1268(+)